VGNWKGVRRRRTEKCRKSFIQVKCDRENQRRKLFLGGELETETLLLVVFVYLLTVGAEGNYCRWAHSVTHTVSRTPLDE